MADGTWSIRSHQLYDRHHRLHDGVPQFGFHLSDGIVVVTEFHAGYVAAVQGDAVLWSAGATDPEIASRHMSVSLVEPRFAGVADSDGHAYVTDAHAIWRADLATGELVQIASATDLGLADPGNAVWVPASGLWVNDIMGHQVLRLDSTGAVIDRLGDGTDGFATGTVSLDDVRFGRIYDLRSGPDGRIWVLDSTHYALRVIDTVTRTVITVVGDGTPGDRGDGGPGTEARLGSDPDSDFDGPWSIAVDDAGHVYIGDTHQRAVRRLDATTGILTTIATSTMDASETQASSLFTLICGLDWNPATGELHVPDRISDDQDALIVLAPRATMP